MLRIDPRALASGAMIALSAPPIGWSPLMWVALVPWLDALKRAKSWKEALIHGFWVGFFYNVIVYCWVPYAMKNYGGVPWPLSIAGLLIFSAIGQPQCLLLAPALRKLDKLGRASRGGLAAAAAAVAAAFLYAAADWFLPKVFTDTLGHVFYRARDLRQLAAVGGAHLITALAVLVNFAVWTVFDRLRARAEPSLWPALRRSVATSAIAAGAVAAALSYGAASRRAIDAAIAKPERAIRAGVVQANIGDFDKVAAETGISGAANLIVGKFIRMSSELAGAQPPPHFVVWPETAYPSTFRRPPTTADLARDLMVEEFVRGRGIHVFFGGYDRDFGRDFNTVFFLSPRRDPGLRGQGDLRIYHKNILLPFGEYIPWVEDTRFFKSVFPQMGFFGRGLGPEAVPVDFAGVGTVKFGPVICYEILFPEFVLGAARKGSQVILNVTNDSWFGSYGEPDLHLALSAFRSIESRLPQVRATNTGISALILQNGEIVNATGINETVGRIYEVPLFTPPQTPMYAFGRYVGWIALAAGALAAAAAWALSRRGAQAAAPSRA